VDITQLPDVTIAKVLKLLFSITEFPPVFEIESYKYPLIIHAEGNVIPAEHVTVVFELAVPADASARLVLIFIIHVGPLGDPVKT